MEKIILRGATSQISRYLIPSLLSQTDAELTLFARKATGRLSNYKDNARVTLIDGDWNDEAALEAAIRGKSMVYLATGHFQQANENVVAAMKAVGVDRLIVAGGLGIFDEVSGDFGDWNARMMGSYTNIKKAAAVIDNSGLATTFMRMSWLYNQDGNSNYELIRKGAPFKDTQVTRQAVAQFVTDIVKNPSLAQGENIGVGEPGTHWAKPAFL